MQFHKSHIILNYGNKQYNMNKMNYTSVQSDISKEGYKI